MLGEQGIERGEVPCFLRVHVLHEREEGGVRAREGWGLRGVDERGGQFAGLVDSELEGGEVSMMRADSVC